MTKHKMIVDRWSASSIDVEVEAGSFEEAEDKALEIAYNTVFPAGKSAEYEVTYISDEEEDELV
jgi:hypothetical protein